MSAPDLFSRIAKVMLPYGGRMVVVNEAYIDESEFLERPKGLILAGYLWTEEGSQAFRDAWQPILDENDMPYFRMSTFKDGNPPFKHLDKPKRIEIESELIRLTREHSEYGFAVIVNASRYDAIVGKNPILPTAYSYAMFLCVSMLRTWSEQNDFSGEIAYFFEEGYHGFEGAGAVLARMMANTEADNFRYGGHSFVKKRTPQLHPGDLLAWLAGNDFMKGVTGNNRPTRKDLEALIRDDDSYKLVEDKHLHALRRIIDGGAVPSDFENDGD